MENLYELTLIVNRIKTRRIEIIGNERTKYDSLTKKLYDGIVSGKYTTDREAAIDIYGIDFKPNTYTRLKTILTERLINTLFFIDVSDYNFNEFQRAYIDCEKLRPAIKILLSRGAKGVAIKLAEKLVRKSMKYEFTDITLEMSRLLRRHYRTHNYQPEKEKLYDAIVQHYLHVLNAEIEVENCYELIVREIISKKRDEKILTSIQEKIDKINGLFPKYESYKLGLISYMATVQQLEYVKDYRAIAQTCQKAIMYFKKKEVLVSKNIIHQFNGRLLSVSIPLKQFENGKAIAESLLQSLDDGTINWYIALDNYFLLSLHTGNFEKAVELYEKAVSQKRFRNLTDDYHELWRVYEAYLEYLRTIGEITVPSLRRFRLSKFMNEVPIFSKDKKGINVAIIIIQTLFLVAQGKEDRVFDRVEALRMYVHTHLRNDSSLRSNCFIKMLVGMVKSNFHRSGTIRRTKKLREKLYSTPILEKSQSQFVEIIPYENLWEMSLSQLRNRAF